MALVILGRRASSGRPHATSIAAELPIVVFGPATLTLIGSGPVVAMTPVWLPDEAVTYADFANANFYGSGDEATLASLLVSTANWGAFNPSDVVEGVGLTGGAAAFGLSGTDLADGLTAIVDWIAIDTGSSSEILLEYLDDPDYLGDSSVFGPSAIGGGSRIAATFTPSRQAYSINGAGVVADETDTGTGFNTFVVEAPANTVVTAVTLYAPADDADLPALSTL